MFSILLNSQSKNKLMYGLASLFVFFLLFALPLHSSSLNTSPLNAASDQQLIIDLELPRLDVQPYHKPYVAIWLEDENREHVATLALWAKEDTWYKDLRQWWRKIGRNDPAAYDAVSGATRLPGKHKITWCNSDLKLDAGTYLLNIEASREEGDRTYHRQAFKFGENKNLILPAEGEFGTIQISLE